MLAVGLTGLASWLVIGIQALGRDAGEPLTLGGLVPVVVAAGVVAGIVVFTLGGHRWRLPRLGRPAPAVYAHLADLL